MHKSQKKYEEFLKKDLIKMYNLGMDFDDLDRWLVNERGYTPEQSWKLIKSTFRLKVKGKTLEEAKEIYQY